MEVIEPPQTNTTLFNSFTDWGTFWKYVTGKTRHTGFRKYLKNTGWMFLAQMGNLISLAVNILLARYLGPTNFGILSYIFAFVGLFAFLSNLGISGILVRDLVKYPEKRDELLGTAFWLLTSGGILAFCLVIISSFIFESTPIIRTMIILYSTIFLWSPIGVISYYFQATVQGKKIAFAQILNTIIVSIVKIILIIASKGIIWLTLIFTLDFIIGGIINIYIYTASGLKIRLWKFNLSLAKDFIYSSWFLMLSAIAGYLLLRIDQVMVKFYLGSTEVGLYAVAVRLSEIWYFIPGIICASLFPAIINAKKTNKEMYLGRLRKLYVLMGGIAFLIAIPVTALAPWIIKILFGIQYIASVPVLQIYVWSGIGLFVSTAIIQYFTAENYLKTIFYYNLLAVIMNIILNIILIPKIGLTGAAWSTLVSYSIGPIIVLVADRFPVIKKL